MTTKGKIVLAGGSGFCGSILADWFGEKGWEVVILSRGRGHGKGRLVNWDGENVGPWAKELEGATAVVNLAGKSVDCRYNAENRAKIMNSRVRSTRVIGKALRGCENPPLVWLNSSTATIYRDARDRTQDEFDGEIGTGFSVDVAQAWEAALNEAEISPGIRRVAMRLSMVMGAREKTVFDVLCKLTRLGLGGAVGPGNQRVAWIHEKDYARAIEFLIEHKELDGAVNITAPVSPTNREMMRVIRKQLGMPTGLPATSWMVEIGTFLMRTEAELILKSRWVAPTRLERAGFGFGFPKFEEAVAEIQPRLAAEKKKSHKI